MGQTIRLIWALFTRRERRQFVYLLCLTVLMGAFEVAGVAAILPFLSLLGDPGLAATGPLAWLAGPLGLTDPRAVTVTAGLGVLILLLLGMAVRALGTYLQTRFAMMRAYTLSTRLLRLTLRQPYVRFLSQSTADLGQDLLSEIDVIVRQSILPVLILSSAVSMTLMIALVLLLAEPAVAIGAGLTLGTIYLGVFRLLKGPLDRVGAARVALNRDRFRIVQEIGGGIKDIKMLRLEEVALRRFDGPARGTAGAMATAQTLGRLPRFVLEAMIYGGFIGTILWLLMARGREIAELVPLLGLLGVAGIKLFPALQQIYAQLSVMRFTLPALVALHTRMTALDAPAPVAEGAPLRLTRRLDLEGLGFTYPGAAKATLRDVSTVIPARTMVGIVGGTGAGKTTLVDLILGLLDPAHGTIRVDGVALTPARVRDWQSGLGYVPQEVFLADDTIAANIAFGVPDAEIDWNRVETVARIAQLQQVIAALTEGYATRVGERGARLSGGQRQRIGIARALYDDPEVLILDEATSALDPATERAVMEGLRRFGGQKTILLIAHRMSTVKGCDSILVLRDGCLAAEGSYARLMAEDAEFRRLATV